MRRLFVLSWLLAAGTASAAIPRVPAVGTQLSLFAPVPVLAPVAEKSFFFPSPTLVVPAAIPLNAAPVFAPMPEPVKAAFFAGDPAGFVKAVRAEDYEIPEGDEHQSALYQLGLEREAADRRVLALMDAAEPGPVAKPKRATKIDYEEFGRQLAKHPGLSSSPFQHGPAKRKILKASGYDRLRGPEGPVTIERATDARVGMAFAHVLRAYERR